MNLDQLISEYGSAISRIAGSYEREPERSQELAQEIWTEIWLSLAHFKEQSSLKTWVYRIGYNVAISHCLRESKQTKFSSIEDIDVGSTEETSGVENRQILEKIQKILQELQPLDRQLFMLYLEGEKQTDISQICGLSETNVSTKISRIKSMLQKRFALGDSHD